MVTAELIDKFTAIVGKAHIFVGKDCPPSYYEEPRGRFGQCPALLLRPKDKYQIAEILCLAVQYGLFVTAQGGNTGLVGGQQVVPDLEGQILLSLERLNQIYEVNPVSNYIYAEAGVYLADLQRAAQEKDRLFPLSLASEEICQLGGNLSTNAGGLAVLAYGNSRDLCLGLEVVLADGRIINDLRFVKKDNSGYSLKDLFIGAEGTLGIITAAVMKIFPKPAKQDLAYIAFHDLKECLNFFLKLQNDLGFALTAAEFLDNFAFIQAQNYARQLNKLKDKILFEQNYGCYLLVEATSFRHNQISLEDFLIEAAEEGLLQTAILAKNEAEKQLFWQLREFMSVAQKALGASIKNDISVPLHHLAVFLEEAKILVKQFLKDAPIVCFGHIGDGNLHYNIAQGSSWKKDAFLAQERPLQEALYKLVMEFGGAFSAEHGIGQRKIAEMERYKCRHSLELMQQIKKNLDPKGQMNPRKVLP